MDVHILVIELAPTPFSPPVMEDNFTSSNFQVAMSNIYKPVYIYIIKSGFKIKSLGSLLYIARSFFYICKLKLFKTNNSNFCIYKHFRSVLQIGRYFNFSISHISISTIQYHDLQSGHKLNFVEKKERATYL